MKLNKLFTFTLAALAMAACSNDDEPGIDKGGQKGELIDAIVIQTIRMLQLQSVRAMWQLPGRRKICVRSTVYAREIVFMWL